MEATATTDKNTEDDHMARPSLSQVQGDVQSPLPVKSCYCMTAETDSETSHVLKYLIFALVCQAPKRQR